MANVKKAFTGEVRDLVDPYIDVHFAGQRVNTITIHYSHICIKFGECFSFICNSYADSIINIPTTKGIQSIISH